MNDALTLDVQTPDRSLGGAGQIDLTPELLRRPINQALYDRALAEGLHPLLARIFAGRLADAQCSISDLAYPSLKSVAHPSLLKDADRAAERLAHAVMHGQMIGILTDYDVDGITSHAVIYKALTEMLRVPAQQLISLIGHRMKDGYGLSNSLADRILNAEVLPSVIITADCGTSDEPRIARLKAAGIDVIVTDHHAIPVEGVPSSAYAVVNPTQDDCRYPDRTIAGVGVSWLVMSLLRNRLVEVGYLPQSTQKLTGLLAFVALGTVADCVSLGGSAINRAFVKVGLQLMNNSNEPCWMAYRQLAGDRFKAFDAGTLGFQLGPRINARSRMADPYAALYFLLSEDMQAAQYYLTQLSTDNEERKAVEKGMVVTARDIASQQAAEGRSGLAFFIEDGHPGVQGIVASRIVEKYGRPTVVFTQADDPEHLVASARSVPGIHIRDAIQSIADRRPEVMVKFGGHAGAAGMTILKRELDAFQELFDQAIQEQANQTATKLHPKVMTDGSLEPEWITLETHALLAHLDPFGREFESPLFDGQFQVQDAQRIGADKTHLRLQLALPGSNVSVKAIWFKAAANEEAPSPVSIGDQVHLVFKLDSNTFRDNTTLQLQIEQRIGV
ncbi:MAG: single-stranded-DNA-specific exonuclease RecJ [Marinospirillum sp.]|uniref:single-stranded-DNA-specific exonuclease RecJ n=1 Tax=Marinospirillum sp. TaxID=2183934 RepID=UPI0019F17ABD|nr:single-stranded-DNA-specific exonuclease RecJ [Marinospirillum sp.]MBE0508019.1 single-stranded-DNA-specific exonuclease RecJ [Marinospirillum sp.]